MRLINGKNKYKEKLKKKVYIMWHCLIGHNLQNIN